LEQSKYYSNGKLLITGEYLVLHGALALAVPTIPGQEMQVEKGSKAGVLQWKSNYKDECWFEAEFSLPGLEILHTDNIKTAIYLQNLLIAAKQNKPATLEKNDSIKVSAILGFRREWGLGSSSSLINNIASWFGIDPFDLFFETQKGSGYDLACAHTNGAIWYRLDKDNPLAVHVIFDPPFADNLAFIYSGRKQDSAASVVDFLKNKVATQDAVNRISQIGKQITLAQTQEDFNTLLDEHEDIMADVLQMPKVKDQNFQDFPGSIKSLGAWGGDFILASSDIGFENIKSYFADKGLNVIFSFQELVLDN
jgi:mevalonate kinase